ncbi:uncharacterized protein LOC141690993 [Apium graveolens]|uniref:uncharacterized protein LOC141690991 n=1 Tax=Apium graveolens TaxID=4045 RepID=UPI003D79D566
MKESDAVEDFSMKLNGLVTNIKALGETIDESYVVKKFLRSVPKKFLQITSAIEQFGDLENMTIEEVIGSLKAHEERLKGKQVENTRGQLLLTEKEWMKRERNDGQLLLTKEEWLKRSKAGGTEVSPNSKFQNNNGNQANRGGRDRKGSTEKESTLLLNENSLSPRLKKAEKEVDSNVWYLDNGASNHMTSQRAKFRELEEGVTGLVKFGDESTVEIKGKGSVVFKCKNGEDIIFKEVYYIPKLYNNIISLGQLSENGNIVV